MLLLSFAYISIHLIRSTHVFVSLTPIRCCINLHPNLWHNFLVVVVITLTPFLYLRLCDLMLGNSKNEYKSSTTFLQIFWIPLVVITRFIYHLKLWFEGKSRHAIFYVWKYVYIRILYLENVLLLFQVRIKIFTT